MNSLNSAPGVDRLELMQTFVRIVEAGSLSAAAQQMATSQPTVSRRLQALERTLGLRLLQRSTHSMRLTEDGERCYAHAKALLADWSSMEEELRGTQETPRGTLRVLVPHAFGQDQLIAPLLGYLHRYPDVSVEWKLQDRQPDFIAEGLDCAVQIGAVEDPSVVAIQLAEVPRIVVAAPSLIENRPFPLHPSELVDLPWMALSTFYQREVCLTHTETWQELRFGIAPRLASDSLYALRTSALAGLGALVSSAWMMEADLLAGRLVRLAPSWQAAPLPVYLTYPYARFYPARLRAFQEAMRAAMPGLTGMRAPQGPRHP